MILPQIIVKGNKRIIGYIRSKLEGPTLLIQVSLATQ